MIRPTREADLPRLREIERAAGHGCAHIEQIPVHPSHAGRRIGRALIEHLAGWALERNLPAMTLTTCTDVPWNAPYYRRCGFHDLTDEDLTPRLRRIRAAEAARGLDRWPRACLRREL